jgi:hypothetical protein
MVAIKPPGPGQQAHENRSKWPVMPYTGANKDQQWGGAFLIH